MHFQRLTETCSLFSRFAKNHYSGLPIKVVRSQRGCGKWDCCHSCITGLGVFWSRKASSSTQPEMDFDITPEGTSAEATSSILTTQTPTKRNQFAIFHEDDTIGPSETLETSTEGLPSYPIGPVESPTSVDLSDHVESPSVDATVDPLHQKVPPLGLTTTKPILPAAIPSELMPTEDLISHLTPDNFLMKRDRLSGQCHLPTWR